MMKIKSRNQIIILVCAMISFAMIVVFVQSTSAYSFFNMRSTYLVEELTLLSAVFLSAVFFIGNVIFERVPKKYVEIIFFIQCVTTLAGCLYLSRLVSFDCYNIEECFTELSKYVFYASFFLYLFISERFNKSNTLLLFFGGVYIVLTILSLWEYNTATITEEVSLANVSLYFLYIFVVDRFTDIDKDGNKLKTKNKPETKPACLFEELKKSVNYMRIILLVGSIIVFVSTTVYLILLNGDYIVNFFESRLTELVSYGSLSIFAAILTREMAKRKNTKTLKIVMPYVMALLVTLIVLLLNNLYHFISFNSMFKWVDPVSFFSFLKEDITYKIFSGWIRYPSVFLCNIILQYAFCLIKNKKEKPDSDSEPKRQNIIQFPNQAAMNG